MSGTKILDQLEIQLRDIKTNNLITTYFDIYDNSLSRKWLSSLNHLLNNNYYLEKNYCFFGFVNSDRNGAYILDQVNQSIAAINQANLGYQIDDYFSMENTITDELVNGGRSCGRNIIHEKFNWLHR